MESNMADKIAACTVYVLSHCYMKVHDSAFFYF